MCVLSRKFFSNFILPNLEIPVLKKHGAFGPKWVIRVKFPTCVSYEAELEKPLYNSLQRAGSVSDRSSSPSNVREPHHYPLGKRDLLAQRIF